jgi:hypothetical protein
MKKKISRGIAVCAWIEILIGAISLLILIYGLYNFLRGLYLVNLYSNPTDISNIMALKGATGIRDLGKVLCCFFFLPSFFFILGIGMLRLRRNSQ